MIRGFIALTTALVALSFPASHAAAAPVVQAAKVQQWEVNRPRSSLKFSSFKDGQPFTVLFQSWNAEIFFDPDHPELSSAVVTVDTRSGSMGDKTFTEYLVTPSWFKPAEVPFAQFQAFSFTKIAENVYQASGILNLYNEKKTVVVPVPGISIPFTVEMKKPRKGKKQDANFVSHFTFGVPDYSKGASKNAVRKIALDMTIKTTKAEAQEPSGK